MDPAFRNQIKDSYGQTLKMTWYMMGGNTFRYATNTNVPLDNTMVLYLMKKYHGDAIDTWGDEVTLHYHDWIWSDFNGDGRYWWNQSTSFPEFKEDFDLIMAQFLLEENVYPVSFRSGWHYMNTEWQNYLNGLLPFSMHDDYPHVRADTVEPLDNIYDWSKSAKEFVPFHPSTSNYQLPGDGKGWDNRSIYMASMDTTLMDHVFSQAQKGIDQVVCIWAHLPEDNFLDNIKRIDQIAHGSASRYPDVKFRYCTAVEAMQRWMKATGLPKPSLNFGYEESGGKVNLVVTTNEPIFQSQPFVAVKDRDQQYSIVQFSQVGQNQWRSVNSFDAGMLAKAGAAVTDTVGNLATAFINFLPDDIYIDNLDSGYAEARGNWSTSTTVAWGTNWRQAVLGPNDSAKVVWTPKIERSCPYSLFVQAPRTSNPVTSIGFRIYSGGQLVNSARFDSPMPDRQWVYVGTMTLDSLQDTRVEETFYSDSTSGEMASADVIRLSAVIIDRRLSIPQSMVDFGTVSQDDSASFDLELRNDGIESLTVSGITIRGNDVTCSAAFPLTIPPMSKTVLPLLFRAGNANSVRDTLYIFSNDSLNPVYPVEYHATLRPYFSIVDNEDSLHYSERGVWTYSNARAYGPTSRYANLQQSPPASATYSVVLKRTGIYDIQEIVPKTVNAAMNALYVLIIDGVPVDSVYVNQNTGSGDWVTIARSFLPAGPIIQLKVIDSGEKTSGVVLRADAAQFSIVKEVTGAEGRVADNLPKDFELSQNYPNPFNPTTIINYQLPMNSHVNLKVYDVLGREVRTLVNANENSGTYEIRFDAAGLPSGVYFYRLEAIGENGKRFSSVKKLLLMK